MEDDHESSRSETEEFERDLDFALNPNDYYPPGHENRIAHVRDQMHEQIRALPRHKSRKTIFTRLLHSKRQKARKSEKQALNGLEEKEAKDNHDDDFIYTADIDDDDDDYALYEFDDGMEPYGDEKEMDFLAINNNSNNNNNNNSNNSNNNQNNNKTNNNSNKKINFKNNKNNPNKNINNKHKNGLKKGSKGRPSYHNPLHFNHKIFKRSGYTIDRCMSSEVKLFLLLLLLLVYLI